MHIGTRARRIGITGSARSGKTVFLLSLISNFKDGLKLDIGETSRFKKCVIHKNEGREFDYDGLRKHLAAIKVWPHKTKDSFLFRCKFEAKIKNSKREHELDFFDFPGERMADVTMIGQSYEEWSDQMLKALRDDPRKGNHAALFLEGTNANPFDREKLLAEWKLSLARLFLNCHALISPSTFLVDTIGKDVRELVKKWRTTNKVEKIDTSETPEEIAAACCSGLPGAEFAPLSENLRQQSVEMARDFKRHYNRYQREVVCPLSKNLLSCHSIIFLVDVADVLASGMQKLNDTQEIIQKLLEWIDGVNGPWSQRLRSTKNLVLQRFGKKSRFIERIAFVASKADKIAKSDRDNLKGLITDLAGKIARNAGPRNWGCFSCKSVNSTKDVDGEDRKLVGRSIWGMKSEGSKERSPGDVACTVTVPALPEHWPAESWKPDDYCFTDFFPEIPARDQEPFKQVGLEQVLNYVLKD